MIGRCNFMTGPGGNFQRFTVRTASSFNNGHFDGDFANAEITRPLVSIVNSTSTVPVCPCLLAAAGYDGEGIRPAANRDAVDIPLPPGCPPAAGLPEPLPPRLPVVGFDVVAPPRAAFNAEAEGLGFVAGLGFGGGGKSGISGNDETSASSGNSGGASGTSNISSTSTGSAGPALSPSVISASCGAGSPKLKSYGSNIASVSSSTTTSAIR